MIRIETNDGEIFTGNDAKDITRQMRDTQWNAPARKGDYIEEVVERVESLTGVAPPSAHPSAEAFLQYLERAKVITAEIVDLSETGLLPPNVR